MFLGRRHLAAALAVASMSLALTVAYSRKTLLITGKDVVDNGHGDLLGPAFRCNKVAFFKSHKTASTTLASTLYRLGVYHGKRWAEVCCPRRMAAIVSKASRALPVVSPGTSRFAKLGAAFPRFHADTGTEHVLSRLTEQPADLIINHSTMSFLKMLPHYMHVVGDGHDAPGLLTVRLINPPEHYWLMHNHLIVCKQLVKI